MMKDTTEFPLTHQGRGITIRTVLAIVGVFLYVWCMMASGYSGAEDEAVPKTHELSEESVATPKAVEPVQAGVVPRHVMDAIERLLQEQAFDGRVIQHHAEYDAGLEYPRGLDYAYRCERYRTHARNRMAYQPEPSWAILGPTQDGFRLTLKWYAAEQIERVKSPATLIGYNGKIDPYQYWHRYDNYYKLPNDGGFIALTWQMNEGSDQKIFADVRAMLEAFGPPVYKDAPDLWIGNEFDLDPERIQQLTDIVGKLQPGAKWRRDGQSQVCEYKIHEFDVHQVSEDGVVTTVPHHEVGPLTSGFIIRLTPDGDFYDDTGRRVKPLYGRTAGPYWYHYYATYGGGSGRCRLDIMYGQGVDKNVLEEVTAALEKPNGPPERF